MMESQPQSCLLRQTNQEVISFMKSFRSISLFALLLALAPAVLAADFGIRAGTYTDASEQF